MRCLQCGATMDEHVSTCPSCGKPMGSGDFPWFDLDEVLQDAAHQATGAPAGEAPPAGPRTDGPGPPDPAPAAAPSRRKPLVIGGLLLALLVAVGVLAFLRRPAPVPPPAVSVPARAVPPDAPSPPAAPTATPGTADPANLAGRINVALRESGLPGIIADVDDKLVVTLTGSIEAQADKTRALTLVVRRFKGINGLRDRITVTRREAAPPAP